MPALAAVQLMLAVVLAALAALHIYLTVLNNRQARRLQQCEVNRQAFNGLVRETFAYASRVNPALLPDLADAGLRLSPMTNDPAGVPATPRRP